MVCSVDHRASQAGAAILAEGGNAADAAIATSAALAVTTQHMCGLGGDLFALVHNGEGDPTCLNASGRAGSGADPQRLRDEGHTQMPFRGDIRSAPVPGCVDGWTELHRRHGRLPFPEVLAPAIQLASDGFEVPNHLARASVQVADVPGAENYYRLTPGQTLQRPLVAEGLRTIAEEGRQGWYEGRFGQALIEFGQGEYTSDDLADSHADWVTPLQADVWGHTVWTVPPNSQGYLSLAAARILQGIDIPPEENATWAHLLIEAAKLAGYDRPEVLWDGADGAALISEDRLAPRRAQLDPSRASTPGGTYGDGGTIYLCATDADDMGVSLIQSNASGFGAHLVVPGTGVFLHNRGLGFSLEPDHPAEYGPRRRPPHTLSPALVTRPDGSLRTVLGTMGGDAQPQVVLQMLSRLLVGQASPGEVLARPRWVLEAAQSSGFNTWSDPTALVVVLEPEAEPWQSGLDDLGHMTQCRPVNVGHAHIIDLDAAGTHHGAAEPRVSTSSAAFPEARGRA